MNVRKILSLAACLVFMFFMSSCDVLTLSSDEPDGVALVSVGAGASRTAVPTKLEDGFSFVFQMERSADEKTGKAEYDSILKNWESYDEMTSDSFSAAIGTWNCTLLATKGTTVLSGALDGVEIKSGSNPISILLALKDYSLSTTGTISYVLKFTNDVSAQTTYTARATLQRVGGSDIDDAQISYESSDIPVSANVYSLSYRYDSAVCGYYILKIVITATTSDGNTTNATNTTYTDLVYVAPAFITEKQETITLNALEVITLHFCDDETKTATWFVNKNETNALPDSSYLADPDDDADTDDAIVKTGYQFDGWYVDALYETQAAVTDGGVPIIDSSHHSYYLKWAPKVYTITCPYPADATIKSLNGATDAGNYKMMFTVTYGGSYPASLPVLNSRSEYAFLGWNTKEDGTGTVVTDGMTVDASSLSGTDGTEATLYAKWLYINMKTGDDIYSLMVETKEWNATATSFVPSSSGPEDDASSVVFTSGGETPLKVWLDGTVLKYYLEGITDGTYPNARIPFNASTGNMFQNFALIETIDLCYFDTSNVTDMSFMFSYCSNLTTVEGIDLFNTSKVTTFAGMFMNCTSLQTVDVSSFSSESLSNISNMFSGCTTLTTIYSAQDTDWSDVNTGSSVFTNCSALTDGTTAWTSVKNSKTYARVGNYTDPSNPVPGYFTPKP